MGIIEDHNGTVLSKETRLGVKKLWPISQKKNGIGMIEDNYWIVLLKKSIVVHLM